MSSAAASGRRQPLATFSLVAGALIWGVIWYPYRILNEWGVGGISSTLLTYAIAFGVGLILLRRHLVALKPSLALLLIGLSAGGCNLGYVLSTMHGEVMRVLLLFYLAPLWTVLLARLLLAERLNAVGAAIIGLSLAGAATMLWHADLGMPWPRSGAEWIGLAAGFLFALSNVLIRRSAEIDIAVKTLAVCLGVIVISLSCLAVGLESPPTTLGIGSAVVLVTLGLILLLINLVVQYGLMRVAANRAIVILLSELIFAAISSWWLAGETMAPREWTGGAMIAAASLLSARLNASDSC